LADGDSWIRHPRDDAQGNDQFVFFLVEVQALDISLSTTKKRVQPLLTGTFLGRPHHPRTGVNGIDVETARGESYSEATRPTADFENS
jgi:hypothetical protein